MNIDRVNISNNGIDRSQSTQQGEPTRGGEKDRKVSTGSDSIALSFRANELNWLANTIDQDRTERLNQVRAQLQTGAYRVPAQDLAEKLIDSNRR
jgi:flagellar biosynthesis anti-sigma factor FlgM